MRFLATAQARSIRSAIYSVVSVLTTAFCWCLQLRRKWKRLHFWEHLSALIIKEKVLDCAFLNTWNSSWVTKSDLGGFFRDTRMHIWCMKKTTTRKTLKYVRDYTLFPYIYAKWRLSPELSEPTCFIPSFWSSDDFQPCMSEPPCHSVSQMPHSWIIWLLSHTEDSIWLPSIHLLLY